MSTILFAALLSFPAQEAEPKPKPRPAPVVSGRRFELEEPQPVSFEVPTNAGPVRGTLYLVRLDARGLEGWGRFDVRGTLDTTSVDTGDPILDAHAGRSVLQSDKGPLVFGATTRLAPRARKGEGATPEDEMLGAGVFLDGRRAGKYVEVRYQWEGDAGGGRLKATVRGTLDELGLKPPSHPFLEVTGPVVLRIDVPLVRDR